MEEDLLESPDSAAGGPAEPLPPPEEMEEERTKDDEILFTDHNQSPPVSRPTKRRREGSLVGEHSKDLLTVRRDFKKFSTNLERVNSHLQFIRDCEDKCLTPKGLRIPIKCNAFMAERTEVKRRFTDTIYSAEHQFVSSLKAHYVTCRDGLKESLETLQEIENSIVPSADPAAVEEHQRLMTRTRENLRKTGERLEEKKTRKLELLGKSKTSESKGGKGNDRGGKQHGKGKRSRGKRRKPNSNGPSTSEPLSLTTPTTSQPNETALIEYLGRALRQLGGGQPPSLPPPPSKTPLREHPKHPAGRDRVRGPN
jgi:hypothetical protein